jgi:hypothetical protein
LTLDGSEDPWTTGAAMTIARSVADVLRNHVVLEYEAIDRMSALGHITPAGT